MDLRGESQNEEVSLIRVLIPSIIDGLLLGTLYGLAAMGLSLIWGVMDVINLAHGAIIALGMFGVYFLFTGLGLSPYLAVGLVALAGLVFGGIMYSISLHRIVNAPPLSTLLSTFGVSMVILGLGTAAFSTSPFNVDFTLGSISVGPVTVLWARIAATASAVAITSLLYLFLYRTRPGKYIRAVSDNREAAALMGIPATRVLALAFAIGVMLAAVSGGLLATLFPFSILSGSSYELKSFVIVVLGGLGNPLGALLGGLILGALEGIIPVFLPNSWLPVIEFGLFVVILLVRPSGLLGEQQT
jgi:branched-chain amino acid transport system permease protein